MSQFATVQVLRRWPPTIAGVHRHLADRRPRCRHRDGGRRDPTCAPPSARQKGPSRLNLAESAGFRSRETRGPTANPARFLRDSRRTISAHVSGSGTGGDGRRFAEILLRPSASPIAPTTRRLPHCRIRHIHSGGRFLPASPSARSGAIAHITTTAHPRTKVVAAKWYSPGAFGQATAKRANDESSEGAPPMKSIIGPRGRGAHPPRSVSARTTKIR